MKNTPMKSQRGQGMTEYVIILVAIAIVCIAIAVRQMMGSKVNDSTVGFTANIYFALHERAQRHCVPFSTPTERERSASGILCQSDSQDTEMELMLVLLSLFAVCTYIESQSGRGSHD